MDKILWCDHLNETSSAVLFHGTINFSLFDEMKSKIFLEFCSLSLLGVEGLRRAFANPGQLICDPIWENRA